MSILGLLVLLVFLQTVSTELEEIVCQDEIAELDCPKGYTINITTAMFGRKDKKNCRRPVSPVPSKCEAPNTLSIVKKKCNLKQSCRVAATNELFGNPCNYFSYLRVTYTCSKNDILTIVSCEHTTLNISCPAEKKIKIVNALYGRKNQLICHPTDQSPPISAYISNNNCASSTTTTFMESKCNNLNNCLVMAENKVLGDPCRDTYKYLEVDFLCN